MADEVNRGEIWLFAFGAPNKRRPVVVLTRQEILPHLSSVCVAPITTVIRDIPTEVVVGEECGLKQRCAVNLDNLATVPKAGLKTFVGTLPPRVLDEACAALGFALGCAD